MSVKKLAPLHVLSLIFCAMLAAQAAPGRADRKLTCEPQFPVAGQRVTFSAANFRTPNLLRWDMGDGMVLASGSNRPDAQEVRMDYKYMTPGIYEVKVYDNNGDVNSAPLTVIVWVKAVEAAPARAEPEKKAVVPEKTAPVPEPPKAEAARPAELETVAAVPAPVKAKKNPLIKIGPYAGLFAPQNDVLKTVYGNNGVIYGGRLGVRAWHGIYVWLSAIQYRVAGKTTLTEEDTTLTLTPLSVFLRLGLSFKSVKPYAGIGFTYMLFNEESPIGNTKGQGGNLSLEAGFEFKITRNFFLDFGARFDQIKVKPGEIDEKIDLGGLQAGLALLFSF
jgi:opacity protein-like surface antigen